MSFAARINEILKAKGVSQVALGAHLGITSQAVNQWVKKSEGTHPRGKRLNLIAGFLGVSPADLLAPVGSPIPGVDDHLHAEFRENEIEQEIKLINIWRSLGHRRQTMLMRIAAVIADEDTNAA